jgi:hypothetical protein
MRHYYPPQVFFLGTTIIVDKFTRTLCIRKPNTLIVAHLAPGTYKDRTHIQWRTDGGGGGEPPAWAENAWSKSSSGPKVCDLKKTHSTPVHTHATPTLARSAPDALTLASAAAPPPPERPTGRSRRSRLAPSPLRALLQSTVSSLHCAAPPPAGTASDSARIEASALEGGQRPAAAGQAAARPGAGRPPARARGARPAASRQSRSPQPALGARVRDCATR